MDVADEIRAYQRKEYLSKFIQNDVRPDNRALGETRPAVSSLPRLKSSFNLFSKHLGLLNSWKIVYKLVHECNRCGLEGPFVGIFD